MVLVREPECPTGQLSIHNKPTQITSVPFLHPFLPLQKLQSWPLVGGKKFPHLQQDQNGGESCF